MFTKNISKILSMLTIINDEIHKCQLSNCPYSTMSNFTKIASVKLIQGQNHEDKISILSASELLKSKIHLCFNMIHTFMAHRKRPQSWSCSDSSSQGQGR